MGLFKDRTINWMFGTMSFLGVACGSVAVLYIQSINKKLRNQTYYQDAFERLNQNQAAVTVLGKPIEVKNIALSDGRNRFEKDHVLVHVPIKGRNVAADFGIEADQSPDAPNEWIVKQLWLQLHNQSFVDKKLLVYKSPQS
jgi:hypothetical protein